MENSPRPNTVRKGHDGEDFASALLLKSGYTIVARNWRSPDSRHEIDIIAEQGQTLAFIEVKSANSTRYGSPATWVHTRKQRAIIRAAQSYIMHIRPRHQGFRFDVITIGPANEDGERPIELIKAAFRVGG